MRNFMVTGPSSRPFTLGVTLMESADACLSRPLPIADPDDDRGLFIAAPKPAQAQVIEHAGRLADIDVFLANNNIRIGGNTQQLPISSGAGGSYNALVGSHF